MQRTGRDAEYRSTVRVVLSRTGKGPSRASTIFLWVPDVNTTYSQERGHASVLATRKEPGQTGQQTTRPGLSLFGEERINRGRFGRIRTMVRILPNKEAERVNTSTSGLKAAASALRS